MSNIDRTLKDIRPSIRAIAPLTYYICWGFALFNIAVSIPLYRLNEVNFSIVGAISIKVWAVIFLLMGLVKLWSLIVNNWKLARTLLIVGVAIKSAWLMELLARTVNGKSFILVAIWALLIYLESTTYVHFIPVERRNE